MKWVLFVCGLVLGAVGAFAGTIYLQQRNRAPDDDQNSLGCEKVLRQQSGCGQWRGDNFRHAFINEKQHFRGLALFTQKSEPRVSRALDDEPPSTLDVTDCYRPRDPFSVSLGASRPMR